MPSTRLGTRFLNHCPPAWQQVGQEKGRGICGTGRLAMKQVSLSYGFGTFKGACSSRKAQSSCHGMRLPPPCLAPPSSEDEIPHRRLGGWISADLEGEIDNFGRLREAAEGDHIDIGPHKLGYVILGNSPAGFDHHVGEGGFQRGGCGVQVLQGKNRRSVVNRS